MDNRKVIGPYSIGQTHLNHLAVLLFFPKEEAHTKFDDCQYVVRK